MKKDSIHISPISKEISTNHRNDDYAVCWVKDEIEGIEIDRVFFPKIANSIFFFDPRVEWKIYKKEDTNSAGYILYLAKEVLNYPVLRKLHINQVRLFNSGEIPLFKLSPGIEVRTQAILEMIDELLGSDLNHKEEAILSLLNTFFVYCDGQCNIKSIVSNDTSKTNVVYNFKKLVDRHVMENHHISYYARLLNISPAYLNECVQNVLSVSAKSIIIEQLLMRSRHELKFSDHTVKEICFKLGFSSPEYFSYFFKNHTGISPSALRKA